MASVSKIDIWNRALHRIHQTQLVETEDDITPAARAGRLHYDDILEETLRAHPWPWAIREKQLTNVNIQTKTWSYSDLQSPYDTFHIPYAFVNSSQVTITHSADGELDDDAYSLDLTEPVTCTLDTPLTSGQSVEIEVTTSRIGWDYVYTLPGDCLRPLALLPEGTRYDQLNVEDRLPFAVMAGDDLDSFLLCTNESSSTFDSLAYIPQFTNVRMMPRDFVEILVWRLASEFADALAKNTKMADRCLKMAERALHLAISTSEVVGHVEQPLTPGLAVR